MLQSETLSQKKQKIKEWRCGYREDERQGKDVKWKCPVWCMKKVARQEIYLGMKLRLNFLP
jgi:hypothetical protein